MNRPLDSSRLIPPSARMWTTEGLTVSAMLANDSSSSRRRLMFSLVSSRAGMVTTGPELKLSAGRPESVRRAAAMERAPTAMPAAIQTAGFVNTDFMAVFFRACA